MRDPKAGKQRMCSLDARGLRPVHEWTGGFERFWNGNFDRLDLVRARPQAGKAGGVTDGIDRTGRARRVSGG